MFYKESLFPGPRPFAWSPTLALTTSTINITATSTTTTTATTSNDDNNNKKCIRGSKIHITWPLKDIWWKSQVLFR